MRRRIKSFTLDGEACQLIEKAAKKAKMSESRLLEELIKENRHKLTRIKRSK